MASSIISLPPQLIGQILGFDDTAHLSLNLWLVGDGRLHELLSQGVHFVELRNERRFDVCFLPHFLSNLRSLRHLIVDRGLMKLPFPRTIEAVGNDSYYRDLYDRKRTFSIIQSLPSTMETLILRFNHSTDIFWPRDDSSPRIDIMSAFPSLERLQLDVRHHWLPSWSSQIPPTLTSLKITLQASIAATMQVMESLPPTLRHLILVVREVELHPQLRLSVVGMLPPALETLVICFPSALCRDEHTSTAALGSYSRNLTAVFIGNAASLFTHSHGHRALHDLISQPLQLGGVTTEKIEALPPFVSSLVLHHQEIIKNLGSAILPKFSQHVTSLDLCGFNVLLDKKLVRLLPRRLTHLGAFFKSFKGYKDGDFPPTLRSLSAPYTSLISHTKYISKLSGLPPLSSFSCDQAMTWSTISNIPRTVMDLHLNLADIDHTPLDLPPNLQSLRISAYALGSYGVMTKGKMKISKATEFYVGGRAPGSVFVTLTVELSSLPRTLASLSVFGLPIPISALVHLPRQLTYFYVSHLVQDALYDPMTEAALDKARDVCEDTLSPTSSLWNENPQVTMVDWLPRSLTNITLIGLYDLPTAAWSRLPPGLQTLSLYPSDSSIRQNVISLLPNHLTALSIKLTQLDDDHCELLLARSLKTLFFHHTTAFSLTTRFQGDPRVGIIEHTDIPLDLNPPHDARARAFHNAAELDQFEDLLPALRG